MSSNDLRDPADDPAGERTGTLFQQTVSRHLVHRAAVSEVFVTDLIPKAADEFRVGAQWPRSSGFFGPKSARHDPALLVETIRQAGLALSHRFYGVPRESHFMIDELAYQIGDEGLRLDRRPADIVLDVTGHDVLRRGGSVAKMAMRVACLREDRPVGSGRASWRVVSPATYARIRRGQLSATAPPRLVPVPPHCVGRAQEDDVVLSPSSVDGRWLLRVDLDHPVMFDHLVDHVPGMVAIEAARQAALLVTSRPDGVPVEGVFRFSRYVELDAPCEVVAETGPPEDGHRDVLVRFEQGGQRAATAELRLLLP